MILALDCSTLTLDLALVRDDLSVQAHRQIAPPLRQSEVLPGAVQDLLTEQGLTLADVSRFVVGLGPGSFTGLRIGLATLKGLAYALKVPLSGASSLAALALEGPPHTELLASAVVKRGELYVGRYTSDGVALAPESSLTVAQLAQLLMSNPQARMLGPALVEYRTPLEALGVPPASFLSGPVVPSAGALVRLAPRPTSFDVQAIFLLEPHYLRGSGAEENPKFPPLPGVEPKARLKED